MEETPAELAEREKRRRQGEIPAILWLAKTIKANHREISQVLQQVRDGPCPYRTILVRKRGGGKRELTIPSPSLKKIQRKISRRILKDFPVAKNVYGFSGGSILDAIKPHLRAKSILCVDIKNAFPSVGPFQIFDLLTKGREIRYADLGGLQSHFWYGPYHKAIVDFKAGHMSWYAARIIMQLTTFHGQLPQGVPTSPRLFDIFCRPLDERLLEFAKKVNGTYTRYADNIFFSMPDETFPKPIKNAVSHRMRKEGFVPHEFKTAQMSRETLRMLGLNLINNQVHNTRRFKRALRLSVHHLNWLLAKRKKGTLEFEKAKQKFRGQMNFALVETLPEKLLNDCRKLEEKLKIKRAVR